jgi:hypothetical protein
LSADGSPTVLNRTFGSLEELKEFDRMATMSSALSTMQADPLRTERGERPKVEDDMSCLSTRDETLSYGNPVGETDPRSLDALRRSYEQQIALITQQWQRDATRAELLEAELTSNAQLEEKRPTIPRLPLRELRGNLRSPRRSTSCDSQTVSRQNSHRFDTASSQRFDTTSSQRFDTASSFADERQCDRRHKPAGIRRRRSYADDRRENRAPVAEEEMERKGSRNSSQVRHHSRGGRARTLWDEESRPVAVSSRTREERRSRDDESPGGRRESRRRREDALRLRDENDALRAQLAIMCSQSMQMQRQETPVAVLILACTLLFFACLLALFA